MSCEEEPVYVKPALDWANMQPKWLAEEYRCRLFLFSWLPMRLRQRIHSDLCISIGKMRGGGKDFAGSPGYMGTPAAKKKEYSTSDKSGGLFNS